MSTGREKRKLLMEREFLVSIVAFLFIVTSDQQITLNNKRLWKLSRFLLLRLGSQKGRGHLMLGGGGEF